VLVTTPPVDGPGVGFTPTSDELLVLALPAGGIDESMRRLMRIELTAAAVLLTALGLGAWLILRRGLRPLEAMAASASTITAGDLTERVSPADDRTEVGQLGLALNTMLDGIEGSFREREATERRLRQFLSDASHELRTPLTSIQGFAELFRLGTDQRPVDLPVILRRIEQEAGRMKVLVEDLLLLARLDETRPQASEPVDLSVLAADACSDVVATAPDRQVTLDAPTPVVVQGDADHLRQAIANLVANAVKHTPAGAPIEVAARVEGDQASVSVRDHGAGLDDATLAHAFDRFWQADAARVGTGSGLGLAIVAGIAEEHGGSVQAANRPDGGAMFTVTVPVAGRTEGPAVN
jgi:two-component system OmpR family sensor kinase